MNTETSTTPRRTSRTWARVLLASLATVIAANIFLPGIAAAAVTRATTHKVARGETLGGIARRYKVTATGLATANGLQNSNKIRVGQRLAIPGVASAKPAPPAKPVATQPVRTATTAPKAAPAAGRCPVNGFNTVVYGFGDPRSGGRLHKGNDIFARRGTPVVANVSGTLRLSKGSIAGLAYHLVGDDGVTYYGSHLDTVQRDNGRIKAGEVIGTVGTTGNAKGTTPHLHFEIRPRGGAAIDPAAQLRVWCNQKR